jgi:hypothetical protein
MLSAREPLLRKLSVGNAPQLRAFRSQNANAESSRSKGAAIFPDIDFAAR